VDRLDGGVVDPIYSDDLPRLIPYAHTIYHVRNRAYQPALGRWMQQDPNATAMSLIEAASHSGRGMGSFRGEALDIRQRHADGENLYHYLRGRPTGGNDPLGLQYGLDVGMTVGQLAADLVSEYSLNLYYDTEWASDWNQSDDSHSRLENDWVDEIVANHVANAMSELGWEAMGPVGLLRDIALLGEDIGEWIIEDGEGAGGTEYASAGNKRSQTPWGFLRRHGERPHQKMILKLMRTGKSRGAAVSTVRVNRQLKDPKTGQTISRLRSDYFGFVAPDKVILGEASSTSSPVADRDKLDKMAKMYRQLGYQVETFHER